jgi:hypothetical protein
MMRREQGSKPATWNRKAMALAVIGAAWIGETRAQTTLDASRLTDLRPLIGHVKNGCFFTGSAYEAFRKSLVRFPIDVKRPIQIDAPPGIVERLGTPNVKDKGDHTEFVIPVTAGHLNGLRVTYIIVAVGNENGIHIEGLEFAATKAEVSARFKNELAQASKWVKSHPSDGTPVSFGIEMRDGRTQLVCDSSN